MSQYPLDVLCEDGPLLAVNKPAGLLTQGVPAGIPTLEAMVKEYLRQKYHKPGNVYLGIPHRLDRPVSGVVVFARNSKAAARLAEQFRDRRVRKIYWALVTGLPSEPSGTLTDWLLKVPEQARVIVVPPDTPGARQAVLHYRVLQTEALQSSTAGVVDAPRSLIEIELDTGRMHQIRVQLGSRGLPIIGDQQYGSRLEFDQALADEPLSQPIALHARRLTLFHPIRYDELTLLAPLPDRWRDWGVTGEEPGEHHHDR